MVKYFPWKKKKEQYLFLMLLNIYLVVLANGIREAEGKKSINIWKGNSKFIHSACALCRAHNLPRKTKRINWQTWKTKKTFSVKNGYINDEWKCQ